MNRNDTIDVLTAISAFDQRTIGESDVDAWHAVLADISRDYALRAVAQHHRDSTERIKAAHVVKLARSARNEELARQALDENPPHAPIDPQLGLPVGGADGKPIWSAYEQHNAIDLPCRTCGAQRDEACTNTQTGLTRKIPCISRIIAGVKAAAV